MPKETLSIVLHKTFTLTCGLVPSCAAVVNSSSRGSVNHVMQTDNPRKGLLVGVTGRGGGSLAGVAGSGCLAGLDWCRI